MITSPAVAIPSDVYNIQLDNYNAEPNVELANVVAGIGSSVYASIYTFGGSDGSNLPDEVQTNSFSNANSWFIASIHQSNFSDHLQRAPNCTTFSPINVRAPKPDQYTGLVTIKSGFKTEANELVPAKLSTS